MSVAELTETAPETSESAFTLPEGVGGWLTPGEGRALAELARGKTVLEIGSFMGLSTICMARTAKKVHSVDWHKGDAGTIRDAGETWTLPAMAVNLRNHGVDDKVVIHAGHADDVLSALAPGSFDLAFVDGAHDFDSVLRDANYALRLVRPGGVLAFHDYTTEPGVRAVAGQLAPAPIGACDDLAWFRAPAPAAAGARVYVAVPAYGPMLPQVAASVYWAARRDNSAVADWSFRMEGGSLLALCFNRHWCLALNQRKTRGWTHWALHHADIEAEMGWLDVMIGEMERTRADILSAAVAIKDERGLLSMGLQDMKSGNVRRFTTKELHELPETFDAGAAGAKEGQCLAVNTGLMLVDLRKPWVDEFPGFTIKDHITKDAEGRLVPLGMPEDWGLSLWAAERGLKVFATRKVKVNHYGHYGYANHKVWGTWETEQGDTLPVE